jgi:hypothetical protein
MKHYKLFEVFIVVMNVKSPFLWSVMPRYLVLETAGRCTGTANENRRDLSNDCGWVTFWYCACALQICFSCWPCLRFERHFQWDVTLCNPLKIRWRFRGTDCLHLQDCYCENPNSCSIIMNYVCAGARYERLSDTEPPSDSRLEPGKQHKVGSEFQLFGIIVQHRRCG